MDFQWLLVWVAAVTLVGVVLTIYDKLAAKRWPRHRVRESALLWLGALGAAGGMFLAMKAIRHKTLHRRFMIGLPMMFFLQVAAVAVVLYYTFS